ncbi:transposase [Streptomyces caatingaensis]|uniref:Transposase n=1 Tax=Streptomyces caatingaensis TaxID=1678637 RepID=A0A0K9XC08_9ACTN|nr:transposase [Streptomyces caatingaensis]KNB50955.1 transposase [Streptomyces caatingaensis]
MEALAQRLVPDEMWEAVRPLLPDVPPRPQGGGRAAADARRVMVAVVYVVTSGCAWQHLPSSFGVSVPTAHRWFTRWSGADLWRRLSETTSGIPALAAWTKVIHECAARRVHP